MRNVTEGCLDYQNIKVYRASVKDGVRLMITDNGIDICDASSPYYYAPADEAGNLSGIQFFKYAITNGDLDVPELTQHDGKRIRSYLAKASQWGKVPEHYKKASEMI